MDKKVTILYCMICLLSFSGCSSGESGQIKIDTGKIDSLIKVEEVNDRTIIVRFGYDAVTAVETTKGIVLVDAGITKILTEKYEKIIENRFPGKNFIYVINTHGHPDHIGGNGVFRQARVIGHENCILEASAGRPGRDSLLIRNRKIAEDYDRQLQHSTPGTAEWNNNFTQKTRYAGAYLDKAENIPVRLPDITLSDSLKLDCDGTTFEMMYFGKFHSGSDILIYSPEIKVLFTGDLFSKYGRPGMSSSLTMTDEERRIQATNWIRKRLTSIETIIDGHGQILTRSDLDSFIDNISRNAQTF